jgi:hypothetical protein
MNLGGVAVLLSDLHQSLKPPEFSHTLITGVCAENEIDILKGHAKDLNIIPNFDIARVYRWLVKELTRMRMETKAPTKTNQASVIGEFMNEHRASTLVINGNADARSGMEQLPIVEPKFNELLVRIEPDTKLLFINAKHLRTYCSKQQIDLKNTLKGLEADRIYLKQIKKRLSKGTKLQSPAVDVYLFDLDNEHFLDAEQFIHADTRD